MRPSYGGTMSTTMAQPATPLAGATRRSRLQGPPLQLLLLLLGLALLPSRKFPLRGLVRSLLIAPFFVMPTVNAVVWKNMLLNPVFGLFSWLTTSVGLGRFDVLAVAPKAGIMAMAVWQWTPFMMLILLAGLQGISDEVREAARVDGATGLSEFRFIILPLLG